MIFDALRRHVAQQLPERLREVVDLSIKDRMRLLRLPNTVHEKSQLYKTLLTPADLLKSQCRSDSSTAKAGRFR